MRPYTIADQSFSEAQTNTCVPDPRRSARAYRVSDGPRCTQAILRPPGIRTSAKDGQASSSADPPSISGLSAFLTGPASAPLASKVAQTSSRALRTRLRELVMGEGTASASESRAAGYAGTG
jgi:hypothetical protein